MDKNIGLFWLKEDFRLHKNLAIIEATKNHDQVCAFYLFKKIKFEHQEAQKWWISKSFTTPLKVKVSCFVKFNYS